MLAAHVQVKEDLSASRAGSLLALLEQELSKQVPSLAHIVIEIEPREGLLREADLDAR